MKIEPPTIPHFAPPDVPMFPIMASNGDIIAYTPSLEVADTITASVNGFGAYAESVAINDDAIAACRAMVDWWEEHENDGQVVPGHIQAAYAAVKKAKG